KPQEFPEILAKYFVRTRQKEEKDLQMHACVADQAIRQGWLNKLVGLEMSSSPKRLFFVLHADQLAFFAQQGGVAKGSMSLDKRTFVKEMTDSKHPFALTHSTLKTELKH